MRRHQPLQLLQLQLPQMQLHGLMQPLLELLLLQRLLQGHST